MENLKKSVLNLLQEDARYSAEMIATVLGAEESAVKDAIAELERDGVIVKYTAVVNAEKVGNDFVDALIEVKVTPKQLGGFEEIAQELSKIDMVKNLYLMSGTYDFAITIEGRTVRDIAAFVSDRLATIDSVISTATHFILKQYKSGGVVLDSDGTEKRELVR